MVNILMCLIVLLVITSMIPKDSPSTLKRVTLIGMMVVWLLSLLLCVEYACSNGEVILSPHLHSLQVDGLSLVFILLTTMLIPVTFITGWRTIDRNVKGYVLSLLTLEIFLLLVWSLLDMFLFYIAFEAILLPMYYIITLWGGRERKYRAAYQLVVYTIAGSFGMLLSLLLIYYEQGNWQYFSLVGVHYSSLREILIGGGVFLALAIKVPMVPFHIWLPEAHVEAPTTGSILLAGLLLKLGTYGILRFFIPLFPIATSNLFPLLATLAIVGVIYTSLTTLRQVDLKKVIAYASIGHMNIVIVGVLSPTIVSVVGSTIMMISHGFVSAGLFLLVGTIYDRSKTRVIRYYRGLSITMPLFSMMLFLFTMANISVPGSFNFLGEILIFMGVHTISPFMTILLAMSIFIGAAYSLWMVNRILFGIPSPYILFYNDLTLREFSLLLSLFIPTIFLGVYPYPFLSLISTALLVNIPWLV